MCKDKSPIQDRSVIYQDPKSVDSHHATDNLNYPKEFQTYLKFVREKMYGRDVRESIARLSQITYKYTEVINSENSKEIKDLKEQLIKEFESEINKLNKIFDGLKDKLLETLKSQNTQDFEKFKNEISKINANAEIIDARSGFNTLKEYLNIISLLDKGKFFKSFPYTNIFNTIKKPSYLFESALDNPGSNFPPSGNYVGLSLAQKDNFFALFSNVLKDTNIKNNFTEDLFRFLRVYIGSSSFSDTTKTNTYAQVQLTPMYELLKSNVIVGGANPYSNPITINLPFSEISFIRFELEDGSIHTRRIKHIDEDIKKSHHSLIYWKAIYDNNLNAGWGGNYQNYAPRWGCIKFFIDGKKLKLWFTSGDVQVHIRYIEIAREAYSTHKVLETPLAGV